MKKTIQIELHDFRSAGGFAPTKTQATFADLPQSAQVVCAVVHRHDTRIFLWCEAEDLKNYYLGKFWVVPLGGIVPEGARFLNYVDIREGEAYAIYQAE